MRKKKFKTFAWEYTRRRGGGRVLYKYTGGAVIVLLRRGACT